MQPSCKEYCIRSKYELNHNTISIVVEPPDPPAKWRPSCFARIYTDDTAVFRAYTPISPHTSTGLRFAIKLYKGGTLSEHIRKKRVGDRLKIVFPVEKRPYIENEFQSVLMIAGGTGVTPMMQILEYRRLSTTDATVFTLLFSNRTKMDVFLGDSLDKYRAFCNVVYLFDNSTNSSADEPHEATKYAINMDVLKKYTTDKNGKRIDFIYVSGPREMLETVCGAKEPDGQGVLKGILKSLDFSADRVYKF